MPHHPTSQQARPESAQDMLRLALDMRAPWELGIVLACLRFMPDVARGDGHPVLVLPGLAAGDLTTIAGRLAQPEGNWQRFDRQPHQGLKKLLFREPRRAAWPNPFSGFY